MSSDAELLLSFQKRNECLLCKGQFLSQGNSRIFLRAAIKEMVQNEKQEAWHNRHWAPRQDICRGSYINIRGFGTGEKMNLRYNIPRNSEIKWTDFHKFAGHFEFVASDPDSQLISSIIPAQLEIKEIVSTPPGIPDANAMIEKNLKRLKAEGYLFLDAYVCRFLLNNKNLFPQSWCEISESESLSNNHGIIRFDGSIYRTPETEDVVLAPFCSRGIWRFGFATVLTHE